MILSDVPLISIIVPIYNAEKYIRECVDSILDQTFIDFQVVLVDDGSTDSSSNICDEYAIKDKRVKVFHKINGGVSSARNLGLKNAQGKYVVFVDSDDWLLNDHVKHLIDSLEGHEAQFAMSYPIKVSEGSYRTESYPSNVINGTNWEIAFTDNLLHWYTSPWGKIYNLDIIKSNNLNFDENMYIGEDALFLFRYLLHVDRAYISNVANYCYRYDSMGSLTKRIFSVESEYISYYYISNVLDDTIMSRDLSPLAIEGLNTIKGHYVRRVMNSLYHNDTDYVRRYHIYNKLSIKMYVECVKTDSVKEWFLQKLLKYKLFFVYDVLRTISVKIQKVCKR